MSSEAIKQAFRVLIAVVASALLARYSGANCDGVEVISQQSVTFGEVYVSSKTEGFLQVDPLMGYLSSDSATAHSDSYTSGKLLVTGSPGAKLALEFQFEPIDYEQHKHVQLVELIVRHSDNEEKFGNKGGRFIFRLPNRANSKGLATASIDIGAVIRYQSLRRSQTANFKVFVECSQSLHDKKSKT